MAGPVSGRRISRRTVRNIIIFAAIAVVLLIAFFAVNHFSNLRAEKAKQDALTKMETAANQIADNVADQLSAVISQLNKLSDSQELISLFTAGDEDALGKQAKVLEKNIEHAMKLRFFLPGKYELDRDSWPPLGFASLDLLRQAEQAGSTPGAEVHGFGGPDAHLVILRQVVDSSKKVVGLIHLSLLIDPYAVLPETITNGYAELVQTTGRSPLVMKTAGDSRYRQGQPVSVDVKDTRWRVNYWAAGISGSSSGEGEGGSLILYMMGLVLLIVLLGVARYYQQHKQEVDKEEPDIETGSNSVVYAGAVKAIMDGLHPGLEKLIPGMPATSMSNPGQSRISQGLTHGDDITAFAKPGSMPEVIASPASPQPAVKPAPKQPAATAKPKSAPKQPAPATSPSAEPVPATIPASIFRAYDIRGVVGKTLTVNAVQTIGQAIGTEAKERGQLGVVVGRDGRTSSPELADALISGLRASGCDVIDIGLVATPVLYFSTFHLETGSGVMLTGSHNGPEYNGLKIVIDNETLSGDAIQSLRQRVESGNMNTGQGSLQSADITADYLRRVTEDIPVALGGAFKIVVDCGNGTAGGIAPQVYRAMGHDVIELYCEIDGNFPNHHPDPSQPENLQALIAKVKETQADIGFAFDGDGDRLGVVDGEGNIIWPDRQLMLFARDVLSRNPGASVIYDVKCSRYLKAIIETSGGKPIMWKTGHSLIKNKMKEINAPIAGEMSGHIFFKERWYGFDDAIYAGARMLEILAGMKTRPADVFADLPGGISTPELRIPLPEKYHAQFMQAMKKKMSFEGAEITDIDGIRADFQNGWGLVRPSNTSPCLTARFEAEDKTALEKIQNEFRDLIHSITPDLKLPF
jgi:phosphomannomutase/phosphoglucomutase